MFFLKGFIACRYSLRKLKNNRAGVSHSNTTLVLSTYLKCFLLLLLHCADEADVSALSWDFRRFLFHALSVGPLRHRLLQLLLKVTQLSHTHYTVRIAFASPDFTHSLCSLGIICGTVLLWYCWDMGLTMVNIVLVQILLCFVNTEFG